MCKFYTLKTTLLVKETFWKTPKNVEINLLHWSGDSYILRCQSFPQFMYSFNIIPIILKATFQVEIDKLILKFDVLRLC